MGNLVNLDQLFVDSNLLVSLPDSLENLQQLSTLDVSVNSLERLPSALFRNISNLNLSGNPGLYPFLAGVDFLGEMSLMTVLILLGINLSSLPQALFSLPNLHYLNLSKNELSVLDVRISRLRRLETLIVNNNQITSIPQAIEAFISLRNFYIDHNRLASLSFALFGLPTLTQVSLQHNLLESLPNLSECDSTLSMCEKVMIGWNCLTTLPSSISKLKNLSELVANNNKMLTLPDSIKER